MNPLLLLGLVGVGAYLVLRPSSASAANAAPGSLAAAQQQAAAATAAQSSLAWSGMPSAPNPAAYGAQAGTLADGTPVYATGQTTPDAGYGTEPIYQSADGLQWLQAGTGGFIQWTPGT